MQRKGDAVFEITFSILVNLEIGLALYDFIAQAVPDVLRSNKLIKINYHEMIQINALLATNLIRNAGQHRVPVAQEIKSKAIFHRAMNNFDQEEKSL